MKMATASMIDTPAIAGEAAIPLDPDERHCGIHPLRRSRSDPIERP